jgi:hypothetical protein
MKRPSSIVFAVIVAVGLSLGAAGVSTAAPRDPGPGPATIEPVPPGRNSPPSAPVNTRVEGGATGDGPADDAHCEWRAAQIDYSFDRMDEDLRAGDDEAAKGWYDNAHERKKQGMQEGCFFTGIA